jgi:cobalt-zinc-cadmium resistance protein CzcA
VLTFNSLGWVFLPRLSEGALVIGIQRLPGTSLDESMRYNTLMEKLPNEVE